jgi:uncharacterized membrane protein YgcG
VKPIIIGQNARGEPVAITAEMRQSTHTHVIGGSGKGKSKFLEWMIRRDIREGHGLCLIDWHGTLYNDVLRYCSHLDVGLHKDFRNLILLNPSKPDFVTGFNPFMNQGADISTQVSRRIDATIRPWGITDTNMMPSFERLCRLLYTFAVEQQETLPNAAQLLQFDRPELREYAVRVISDSYIKQQWQQLAQVKTFKDWREFVLSTENRLSRFLASKTIKRFMGMTSSNVDLLEAMDQGKIVLVNLGSSGFLDRESARVFASLLLNEFFETAMLRATNAPKGQKPKTFTLYLDEFQEYITDDIGSMLDQVRKGGLHMVLAHQHLGHLLDNQRLLQSVLTNARIRAVFGGLPYTDACLLANEMFLPDLNTRQIKKAYYHTIHLYDEQTRNVRSKSSGEGISKSTNWSSGQGSGTSYGSGFGSMSGSGQSSSSSTTVPGMTGSRGTEGWFSQGESMNNSSSESYSDFSSESYSEFSSEGGSEGENRFESEGESEVPVWVPIPIQELGSEAEWSREEKVSKVAELLKHQQERHCFIKLDTEPTQPLKIPFVRDYSQSDQYLLEYEKAVYETQGAITGPEVDILLKENENRFLAAAGDRKLLEEPSKIIDIESPAPREQKKSTMRKGSARSELFSKLRTKDILNED